MPNLGPNTAAVHGPNAAFAIGTNTYSSAETWDLHWYYKVLYEPVSNSQIAYYAASNFKGEFSCDVVLTTDNDWLSALLPITNGDLTVKSATLTYKDISGVTKTTTFQGRWYDVQQKQNKGEFVRYSVKCELSAVPTGF